MSAITHTLGDTLVFVLIPLGLSRLLRGKIPITVIAILLGFAFRAIQTNLAGFGAPSPLGDWMGWFTTIALGFLSGVETSRIRTPGENDSGPLTVPTIGRLVYSSALAVGLPFLVTGGVAYTLMHRWPSLLGASPSIVLTSCALGLCGAVSALPILICLVRELGPARSVGALAIGVAAIDDSALWIGLAILHRAVGGATTASISAPSIAAPFALMLAARGSRSLAALYPSMSKVIAASAAAAMVLLGCFASDRLGLHVLMGAYLAGLLFPRSLIAHLGLHRLDTIVAIVLAPLMLGHSAYLAPRGGLNGLAVVFVLALFVVATLCKVGAVVSVPPSSTLAIRERLAVGSLLQCRGLMGIVAATALYHEGLLPKMLLPAFIVACGLSTLMAKPTFEALMRRERRAAVGKNSEKGATLVIA